MVSDYVVSLSSSTRLLFYYYLLGGKGVLSTKEAQVGYIGL